MTPPSVWVRCRVRPLRGGQSRAVLRLTPTPPYGLVDRGADPALVPRGSYVASLNPETGAHAVAVIPTDAVGVYPTGWNYRVDDPSGRPSYWIEVPSNTPIVDDPDDPLDGQRVIELTDVVRLGAPDPGYVQLVPGPGGGDGTAAQLRAEGTAAVALSGHRLVTPGPSGLVYADNRTLGHAAAPLWLTTGAAAQGAPVSAVAAGPVTEPSWSWTPGPVWLGQSGQLVQTPPAAPALFSAQVGYATTPTTVVIDRGPSIQLV